MNLVIISASHRVKSQTSKVARFLQNQATQFQDVKHIELSQYNLPFWDGSENKGEAWPQIKLSVENADAIIAITPEWNGMASPLLKNFLMMCDLDMTDNKPVMYVSVSSGIGGAYPIAELKMDGGKNNGLIAISEHLIIRNVEQALNIELTGKHDEQLRKRIDYSLEMLARYAKSLSELRKKLLTNPVTNSNSFAYGM